LKVKGKIIEEFIKKFKLEPRENPKLEEALNSFSPPTP
jgi:hypothetical protein